MMSREWSCFERESDFVGMHALRRWEKIDGSESNSDLKVSNACLMSPLEQRVVSCSIDEVQDLPILKEACVQKCYIYM